MINLKFDFEKLGLVLTQSLEHKCVCDTSVLPEAGLPAGCYTQVQ